jgi:DNA-binding CsgD family transcriptional regulator
VPEPRQPPVEALLTLCVVAAVAALTAVGATRGFHSSNVHNGALALSSGLMGAWLLSRRPGQQVARLLLANGLLSAILYAGRQVGLSTTHTADAWWGWLGVWPTALAIALTTWVVLCFPEGRFVSPRWRALTLAGAGLAVASATLSALWPVEYADARVTTPFPFQLPGAEEAATVWSALGHPTYVFLQVLWVIGMVARWRTSDSVVRKQLVWLLGTVVLAVSTLFGGLVIASTPTPGLLMLCLLPVVAGWLLHRLSFAQVVELEAAAGRLAELSPRENDVLDLMAQGLSNNAIAARLHLSPKTVEPAIRSIFRKLGLEDDPASNRRVLAVAEYWRRG